MSALVLTQRLLDFGSQLLMCDKSCGCISVADPGGGEILLPFHVEILWICHCVSKVQYIINKFGPVLHPPPKKPVSRQFLEGLKNNFYNASY